MRRSHPANVVPARIPRRQHGPPGPRTQMSGAGFNEISTMALWAMSSRSRARCLANALLNAGFFLPAKRRMIHGRMAFSAQSEAEDEGSAAALNSA